MLEKNINKLFLDLKNIGATSGFEDKKNAAEQKSKEEENKS